MQETKETKERQRTTLGGDDTAIAEGLAEKHKVRLLEQALSRTLGIGAISDNDVELVLVVLQELEAVADVGCSVGVLEANAHAGKVLLGDADDSLVNVAQNGLLNGVVLDNLTEDTTVTATNNENLLGVRVRVHGQVGDHLLVGELIALGALDDVVQNEDSAVVAALEDQDVLVLGLLVVQDLVNLEAHSLTGPHARLLGEPAIWKIGGVSVVATNPSRRSIEGQGGKGMAGYYSKRGFLLEEK